MLPQSQRARANARDVRPARGIRAAAFSLAAASSLALALGCGGGAKERGDTASASTATLPSTSVDLAEAKNVGDYHSKRFALHVPLPDPRGWRVDDHSAPLLHATHAATHTDLWLDLTTEPSLMNRQRCEARARERGLVPERPLRTVEDVTTVGPDAFDTRIWVAIEPGKDDHAPLLGHVFAFGAFIHKCLFFHFASVVPSARDESVLSDRLAVARTRILGAIELDDFAAVPREKATPARRAP